MTIAIPLDTRRALDAEWTKFRTIRSTVVTLGLAVVVSVGLGALIMAGSIHEEYDTMSAAEQAAYDPLGEGLWFHGLHLGQVLLAVLGALVATSEYATGTIRATLAAIPVRSKVFLAKAGSVAAVSAVAGLVGAFGAFAVAQPILGSRGLDVPLTGGTGLRGVALAALATVGFALLGLSIGFLVRHSAGAITTVIIGMLGLPIIELLLPDSWWTVIRFLPADAGWAMFTPTADTLSPGSASAVFGGYVAFGMVAAALAFARRDA